MSKRHASMNRAYRVVWNEVTGTYCAVSELAKGRGKASPALLLSSFLLTVQPALAMEPAPTALPTGGQIVSGNGSISQSAAAMTIQQNSNQLVADWQTFNIGTQASVQFIQPDASSVALNRVLSADPSYIYGNLSANGQVFLLNTNGVIFGSTARVDVGGLVASSLQLSNADFLAGRYHFTAGAGGMVSNAGRIQAADGGYIAFMAPRVQNSGELIAKQGMVALAAGDKVSLNFSGDRLINFTVDQGAINALADNQQLIQAEGGTVILSASAADALTQSVVNNSGVIEASSLSDKGGRIVLEGDAITLSAGSRIEATGATGGGDVLVGGDWQGSGPMRQATTVTMESGAGIDASASLIGNGGTVVLWSDVKNANSVTAVHGNISARGGPQGGNGGKVETSGYQLRLNGVQVDAGATQGLVGDWLLDPTNLVVASSGGDVTGAAISSALANNNVTMNTSGMGSCTGVTCTSADTGYQGNITINDAITKTAGGISTLTLMANNTIVINEPISSTHNSLNLVLDADFDRVGGGYIKVSADLSTNGGAISFGTSGFTGITTFNGASRQLLLLGATGVSVDFYGPVELSTGLTIGGDNWSVGGNVNFHSTVNSSVSTSNALIIDLDDNTSARTHAGTVTFAGAVGATTALSALTVKPADDGGAKTININGGSIVTSGDLNLDASYGSIQLGSGAGTTLTSNSGNIITAGPINNATGNTSGGLTASANGGSGTIALYGTGVTTAGSQNYTGTLTLHNASTSLEVTGSDTDLYFSNASLNYAGAGGASLTLKATGNVVIGAGRSISSASAPLATTLWADSDGSGTGSVYLYSGTSILSRGGAITLGGGTNILTGFATGGINGGVHGVYLGGTTLDSANGNIIMRGKGMSTGGDGVRLDGVSAANSINSGTGTISITGEVSAGASGIYNAGVRINQSNLTTLTSANTTSNAITISGTGAGVAAGTAAQNSDGVIIENASSLMATGLGGGISITGIAPSTTEGYGVRFLGGANILANGGAINLTGQNGLFGLSLESPTLGFKPATSVTSSNSAITLSTDKIYLGAASTIQSTGTLAVRPYTASTTIGVGGGSGTLSLPQSYFWNGSAGLFKDGFSSITIGSASQSGTLTLGDFTFTDPLVLYAGNGTVTGAGNLSTSNNGLTIHSASGTGTLSGVISLGSGGLTKDGAGTTVLSGTNTYSGTTTISAGTLTVGAGGTSGTLGSGAVTNNAALAFNRSDDVTVANTVSGTGSVTKNGNGTVTLSGTNTYSGGTTVNAGTLFGGAGSLTRTAFGSGLITVNSGATLWTDQSTLSNELALNSGTLMGSNGFGEVWNGAISLTGSATIRTFGGGNNITLANTISGTGSLTKTEAGTLTLSGNNTYSGTTTISAGTLTVGAGGTTGALGSGAIVNDAALIFNRSDDLSVANTISGTGSVTKNGNGTVTLSGTNTYSGGTTVNAGTLFGGAGSLTRTAFGSGLITVNSGATLWTDRSTLSNDLVLNSGTLMGSNGFGEIWNGTVSLTGNATIRAFGGGSNVTLANTVSGTGSLTKTEAGNLTLSGNNTYSGTTTISAGTLTASHANALGSTSSGTTVASGASLMLNGVSVGNEAVTLNGTGVSNAGALQGSGTASLSGALTVNTSATIGGSGSLSLDAISILDGQTLTLGTGAAHNLTTGAISGATGGSTSNLTVNTTGSANLGAIGTDIGAVSITAANTTLSTVTANTVAVTDSGANGVILNGVVTANASNDSNALIIRTPKFTNNHGAGALLAPNGTSRWLVYSTNADPFHASTGDTRNGLVYDFKQYNTSFGGSILGSGNGMIYSYAPTVTAALTGSVSKEYDGTAAASLGAGNLSSSGAVDGDSLSLSISTNNGSFDTKDAGSGKTVTIANASLALSASNGGKTVYGYSLAGTQASGSIGSITPKTLTISGSSAANKTYDGSVAASITAGSLSGFIGTETLGVSGSGSFADKNVGTGKNVATTYILSNGTNGGLASNYTLAGESLTADITAKSLNLSGLAASNKTYDGTLAATISSFGTLSGVMGGDTVSLDTSSSTANFADKHAGSGKTVTVASLGLSGVDAGNYTIGNQLTTADIIAKALSLSGLVASNKIYDGTTAATISSYGALSGVMGGDTVTLNTSSSTASYADKNAGSGKTVTVASLGLSGVDAGNYSIGNQLTTADITAKALSISGSSAANKTYDGSTTASIAAGSLSGLVGSETLNVSGSGSFADKNVGVNKNVTTTYSLSDGGNGGLAANYSLAGETLTADIAAKVLTISGSTAENKTYDGTTTASITAGSLSGMVGSETLNVTGSGSFANKDVGTGKSVATTYILSNGSSGGLASNYSLGGESLIATIFAAPLTVTANNLTRTYDGTAYSGGNGVSYSGFVGGDTAAVMGGTLVYGGTAQGAMNTGSYSIIPSGLTASNYTISFVNGSLTISAISAGRNESVTLPYQPLQATPTLSRAAPVVGVTKLFSISSELNPSMFNVGRSLVIPGTTHSQSETGNVYRAMGHDPGADITTKASMAVSSNLSVVVLYQGGPIIANSLEIQQSGDQLALNARISNSTQSPALPGAISDTIPFSLQSGQGETIVFEAGLTGDGLTIRPLNTAGTLWLAAENNTVIAAALLELQHKHNLTADKFKTIYLDFRASDTI